MRKPQEKGKDWYKTQLRNAYLGLQHSAGCTWEFLSQLREAEGENKILKEKVTLLRDTLEIIIAESEDGRMINTAQVALTECDNS